MRNYKENDDILATQMGALTFSLCVPNECTYEDLKKYVEPMVKPPFQALVYEKGCTSKDNMFTPTVWTWISV